MTTGQRDVRQDTTSAWYQLDGDRAASRLAVALPYAGGSGRAFRTWTRALPPGFALAAVDLPGHGRRLGEPCLRDVDTVTGCLFEEFVRFPPHSLVLIGYSMGGRLAFELAHLLIAAGCPPLGLVVCMARAPQCGLGHPAIARLPVGDAFLRDAVAYGLADPRMLELPQLAATFTGQLHADLAIVESFRYRPRPPLPIPVCVVGARADWLVPEPALRRWNDLCTWPPEQVRVSGGHLAVHENSQEVAGAVHAAIANISQAGEGWLPLSSVNAPGGSR